MRIISDFHDYYDTVLGFGIDNSIVYTRKTIEIKVEEFTKKATKFPSVLSHNYIDRTLVIPFFIGFCGKIYLGCEVVSENGKIKDIFYSYKEIEQFALLHFSEKVNKRFFSKKKKDSWDNSWGISFCHENIKYAFDNQEVLLNKFNNIFTDYQVPLFVCYSPKQKNNFIVELSPRLSDFEFYKKIDTFNAFQNISMFLSGVIGINNKEISTISDKNMLTKKGFDKLSFKTLSPGKKAKRMSNRGQK